MNKKVLIISGSPRKGGNSDLLCDEFMRGAVEAGNEVEKIRVAEKKIGFCSACYYCRQSDRMMDFSGEINVTTDADEMEDLYNRARNLPDGDDKIILLKKAFELYRGRLFIQGEDDIGTWLYTYTTHYNQVYVDLTSALLTTLGHIRDYRCIMDYGPRALEIEPGILTAYYWIIIAADETGNSMAREKFLQKAAEDLIDEENEKLMKLLALRNHMI